MVNVSIDKRVTTYIYMNRSFEIYTAHIEGEIDIELIGLIPRNGFVAINHDHITNGKINKRLNLLDLFYSDTIEEAIERVTDYCNIQGMSEEEIFGYFLTKYT